MIMVVTLHSSRFSILLLELDYLGILPFAEVAAYAVDHCS